MKRFAADRVQVITSGKRGEVKSTVGEFAHSDISLGEVVSKESTVTVFGVAETRPLLAPTLLTEFDVQDHLFFYLDDDLLYILFVIDGVFVEEFEIGSSKSEQKSLHEIQSFFALYEAAIAKCQFSANVVITGVEGGICVGGFADFPLDIKNYRPDFDLNGLILNESIDLKKAIKIQRKKPTKKQVVSIVSAIAGIIVVTALSSYISSIEPEVEEPSYVAMKPVEIKVNEYQGLEDYYTTLSVSPMTIMQQTYRDITRANTLRGWDVKEAKVFINEQGELNEVIKITSNVGSISELTNIVKLGGYSLNVSGKDAYLAKVLDPTPVYRNYARFHIGSYHKWLSSACDEWWDDVDYSIGSVEINAETDNWKLSSAEVTFPVFHPLDLVNVGGLVNGMPYSFEYLEIVQKDALADTWEAVVKFQIAGVDINEQ